MACNAALLFRPPAAVQYGSTAVLNVVVLITVTDYRYCTHCEGCCAHTLRGAVMGLPYFFIGRCGNTTEPIITKMVTGHIRSFVKLPLI